MTATEKMEQGRETPRAFPRVVAITLSYNRKSYTHDCIESLLKMNYSNFEILVVENGSTDGSTEDIKRYFPSITVIEIKTNIGYSRGFNVGIKYAYRRGADYFLILNNDTVIDPDALTELVRTAQADARIGFASGKVYTFREPNILQTVGRYSDPVYIVGEHVGYGERDIGQYETCKTDYDFIDDVFLLVRREVYEFVGGYDPTFHLYWEETDWCVRVRRAGFKIAYVPGAKIWHKGMLTTTTGMNYSSLFYLIRNHFVFSGRHARPGQLFRILVHFVGVEYPVTIMRLVKHRRFRYAIVHAFAIAYGIYWILVNRGPAGWLSSRTRHVALPS